MPNLVVWHTIAMPDEVSGTLAQPYVACLACLVANFHADGWVAEKIYVRHTAELSEQELIKEFFELIGDVKPQLVTFDGWRALGDSAMRHKMTLPNFAPQLLNPLAIEDISLCDVFSPNAANKISLRSLCRRIGIDLAPREENDVRGYIRENRFDDVANVCREELIGLFRFWLRRELFHGNLSRFGFERSEAALSSLA